MLSIFLKNKYIVVNSQKMSRTDHVTGALAIHKTTNQLILGTTLTTTLSFTAPAVSRVYTIPDSGASSSFVLTDGTQTIGGAKTFSSAVTINPTSNQLVLGTTNTITINAAAPTGNRVHSIPDSGITTGNIITSPGVTKVYTNAAHADLTLADSGSTVLISQDAAYTITIPDPAAGNIGCSFKFRINVTGANIVSLNTVTASSNKFLIAIAHGDGVAQTAANTTGQNTVRFAATSTVGDTVELFSNGTLWIGNGIAQLHDKITCP
jgi:hypothetical protein